MITVNGCTFRECKKGVYVEYSSTLVKDCRFTTCGMDYHMVGWDVEVQDYNKISRGSNFAEYRPYHITLLDGEGEPVEGAKVTFHHPDRVQETYVTDEEGRIENVTLLQQRMDNGTRSDHTGYTITVDDEMFRGNATLPADEQNLVLDPSDFSDYNIQGDRVSGEADISLFLGIVFIATLLIILLYTLYVKKTG